MTTEIAEFKPFESQMAEFKKKYDGVVYDLDDEKQEKQARSDRYAIGKVVSKLDDAHKKIKEPLKIQVDLIDGERKRIKDELLDIQNKIKDQIKAHEDAIREHAEMLQGKVDAITVLGEFGEFETPTSDQLLGRIERLDEVEVDDSYEIRKADATLAQVETKKKLTALYEQQKKHEDEQAELERLRQEKEERDRKEREEQIRKEAAEKAKKEALEKAALERMEAERKAKEEQERIQAEADRLVREAHEQAEKKAAEERAKHEEEVRKQKEREAAEAKAKQEKEAAEAKKKARQTHRAKIHSGIKGAFIERGFDEETATKIVELIKDGKINHVIIEY